MSKSGPTIAYCDSKPLKRVQHECKGQILVMSATQGSRKVLGGVRQQRASAEVYPRFLPLPRTNRIGRTISRLTTTTMFCPHKVTVTIASFWQTCNLSTCSIYLPRWNIHKATKFYQHFGLDLSSDRAPTMDIPLWQLESDEIDIQSLKDTNERLRRALCSMERKYRRTKQSLDTASDLLGHNRSPLPFLRLPREIRDQIYALALEAEKPIRIEPRELQYLSLEDDCRKPATPSLLYLNKQVCQEAAEILYSKNEFIVTGPGELLRFEQQVGSRNNGFIRSLKIRIFIYQDMASILDPAYVASYDFKPIPSHWAKALALSELKGVETLKVKIIDCVEHGDDLAVMPPVLQRAIEHFLRERSEKPRERLPKLGLKGFRDSELGKFSKYLNTFKY